jgi:small-conductance mechanosensitive channel
VNNFASGLILLFERPVKIGDTIELEENWGVIKKLGLRATIVQTYDNAEIVVPNSDLISNQVTNWTLAERRIRIKVNVGVAYGSDVDLVLQLLKECADEHELVLKDPAPQALFMGFGDSSLDFELRVWVADFADRRIVPSDMHQAIDRKFRQSNIEIPFPQRDLHVRSLDEAVSSSLKSKELPS